MDNQDKKYEFQGTGLTADQITWGKKRYDEYMTAYPHLRTLGNSQLLEELVWVECILEANKKARAESINAIIKPGSPIKDTKDLVNKGLTDNIQAGRDEVLSLKTKLGMFETHKDKDAFQTIQDIIAKFELYRQQNPSSFKTTCPFCAKCFALMRRTDCYTEFISPFLEDKRTNNRPLMELYHQGKLTKEEAAKVLGVYPKYIDWLDAKVYGRKVAVDTEESAPTNTDQSAPTNQ